MPESGTGRSIQKREAAFRKSERVEPHSMMLGPAEHFTGCTALCCYLLSVLCCVWALVAFALLQMVYLTIKNCPAKDKCSIPLQRYIQIRHMMDGAFSCSVKGLLSD